MSHDIMLKSAYTARYPTLMKIAANLQLHLTSLTSDILHIDSISARAKDPQRFYDKACKTDDEGNLKYSNPIYAIQDQVGARITVLYLSDIDVVKDVIIANFRYIERQKKQPDKDDSFGYFGEHFILKVPDEFIPEGDEENAPEFFELQIKTLFQHAWSECHHDLGYKTARTLTSLQKRNVAFSAAQAWGADMVFEQLARELRDGDNDNEHAG